MSYLLAEDIADVTKAMLRELGPLKIQNIAQDLTDYEVVPRLFKKDKLTIGSGHGIQRNLYTTVSGHARHVGLYDADDVNTADLIEQMTVPWVHVDASWNIEYRSDVLMNSGAAQIVDLVKLKRADAMLSLIKEMEDRFWATPPSTSDRKLPYNLRYWIVANDTEGFNGGAPSGHTTVAGINPTTVTTFRNWTAQYTDATYEDLGQKMSTMHRKTKFKSAVDLADYTKGRGDRYRIYVNNTTMLAFENIVRAQNENLGWDIARVDGMSTAFRKNPIIWAEKLDDSSITNDPVYFVNFDVFYPVCLKGNYFRETRDRAPQQHNIEQYFVDLSYNYMNVDRRRCGVLTTGA